MSSNLLLELLDGGGMVIEAFFILFLLMYLRKETLRRGIGIKEWYHFDLPPSMNLAIAVLVFDFGVFLRTAVIWAWRKFYGAAEFNPNQIMLLSFAAVVIILGGLCKIRAVSFPDYGHFPWLMTALMILLFILGSLIVR